MPAYNEERRLPASLARLDRYVRGLDREVEVIVVENGSGDGTAAVVEECCQRMPYLRLLRVAAAGKGLAVRTGMLAARGDHLMFCDVDFSMPMEEIGKFLALLDAGAPIVIASRELATSQRYHEPVRRHVMGRIFNRV
ncbi:MAG TPA: glycosyltransferase family 2 protein, partial [Chloroflexota bacterium]|nr:glycosyltransferase family 2 protein [Chloroflexota bacterium]